MHIEPGFVAPAKVMLANGTAVTAVGWLIWRTATLPSGFLASVGRTFVAALFFSLFMQSFHAQVGPSELHFIGATTLYLTLGFFPTAIGFAFGLLLQGLLFEPVDLAHLGVNTLSLLLPLLTVHWSHGRKLFEPHSGISVNWRTILKLDAVYYSGVTLMVGFWLMVGELATPFSAWFSFASSYLVVAVCEPMITWTLLKGIRKLGDDSLLTRIFVSRQLTLAS